MSFPSVETSQLTQFQSTGLVLSLVTKISNGCLKSKISSICWIVKLLHPLSNVKQSWITSNVEKAFTLFQLYFRGLTPIIYTNFVERAS